VEAHQLVGQPVRLRSTEVQERLGLGEGYHGWVQELAELGAPSRPLRLPGADEATEYLRRLACHPSDATAVAGCLPSPEGSPALWWLLERCVQRLVGDLGGIDYFVVRWPSLPLSLGLAGRLFYAHVFLAVLADVRAWHRDHGVQDDVSWATLSDLGHGMALYRSVHGEPGLAVQDWLTLHLRGALYQLGRLQFHRSRIVPGLVGAGPLFWYDRSRAEGMGPGFSHGDPVLGLHVPPTGPLTPEACDHSLQRARRFFARVFPSEPYRVVVCSSWMLDDQLADHLPATANIVRFQRRFQLVPGTLDDDAGVLGSVFRRVAPSLDDLSPRTTLQRAVVAHLRAGGHWRIRTGWFEL
jgi:GNAT-like C-terminal domain/N-acyltransferase N-terminal domain